MASTSAPRIAWPSSQRMRHALPLPGLSDAERLRLVQGHVRASAGSYVLIDGEKVSVEAAPLPSDARLFRVVVSYSATELPIWQMRPFLPLPSEMIVRAAVVSRGGY